MSGANAHYQLYQIRQDALVKQESITVYYSHHPYYGKCLPVEKFIVTAILQVIFAEFHIQLLCSFQNVPLNNLQVALQGFGKGL